MTPQIIPSTDLRSEPVPTPTAERDPTRLDERDRTRLLRLAERLLGCHHLAEDALQEATLDLEAQPIRPDRPAAWLTRAIVHRCRHVRRTLRRRAHHEHVASQHCALHGDCDNPLHVAMAHELAERIDAVRASLPLEQRQALDLFTRQGKDYAQIAAELAIPLGTVRSRLARARKALDAVVQQWRAG